MPGAVALVRCPEARIYDHGPQHPLRPQRVLYTWSLIEACGLLELAHVSTLGCRPASDAELELVHSAEFIDATRRAGHGEVDHWARFGYGPGDDPIFPDMHEAGALVAGASLVAAEAVAAGRASHAFNAAGGLHHAMPARASGFCVYDDPAIAIAWLLARGVHPVAYVDVDVHHGDGPQAIFYEDPRVLTISLHQSGDTLFPGTGFVTERGAAGAEGTKVNVPLQPGVSDEAWLTAFRAIVPPIVRAFAPKVLVTQLGCDTHWSDPLANLRLTMRAYRETAAELHTLAHEAAGGNWIATGGGGYQWANVVPRAWTTYFARMCDAELPDALPESWIEQVELAERREIPVTFSEPALEPNVLDPATEGVIETVKRVCFPFFGVEA
ncbi:MAG TPA: acetoin utilization protein AcuC [Actinomycetota bacterium]|nr:acetoin utilization protein AcuC [Actinomycetota bacterium]